MIFLTDMIEKNPLVLGDIVTSLDDSRTRPEFMLSKGPL